MNYFAHAIRFLDRPVFAVATGLPDMLSVIDRKMRLRARRLEPFADGSGSFEAEVAAGAMQHLDDDRWLGLRRVWSDLLKIGIGTLAFSIGISLFKQWVRIERQGE